MRSMISGGSQAALGAVAELAESDRFRDRPETTQDPFGAPPWLRSLALASLSCAPRADFAVPSGLGCSGSSLGEEEMEVKDGLRPAVL